jgi:hypothetical protein
MPDGHEQGRRRRDECEVENQKRKCRKEQRHQVIPYPGVLDARNLALCLSRFETQRAKVLPVEITIAQRAKEATASLAWDHRLLAGVIEAGGLAFYEYKFSLLAWHGFTEIGRIYLHLQPAVAA